MSLSEKTHADEPAELRSEHGTFPVGGGTLGALIRTFDWSQTSLGPIEAWPQSLRTAVDITLNSPVAMVLMWGPDHVMIYNDGYIEIAADRHPRALGGRVCEIWPEIWDWNRAMLETGYRGEALLYRDQSMTLLRGDRAEELWFDFSYVPVRDESGAVGGVLCSAAVVTERLQAERALRDRQADLTRVQQIGRVGGVEVDLRDGFRNRRSPEYLTIHGLPPEAHNETHEDWVRRVHPEDRERVEQQFIDAVNSDVRDYVTEYRIVRPSDGQVRWIAVKAEFERDESGRAVRLVGAHIDITDRKLADQALRESEERFRLIANSAPVPMWVSLLSGKRAFVNQAYMDFLGMSYEQSLSFDWRKVLHPDDLKRILAEQISGEASLQPFVLEARYRRRDGEWRWLRSESQPRWGPSGEHIGFIGVAHDVTEQKLAEENWREREKRQAFLLALGDRMRGQLTPRELSQIAAEMLGDYLGVSRVGYVEIDEAGEYLTVESDWTDGRLQSMAGRHRLEDFGKAAIAMLRVGRSLRIDDALGTNAAPVAGARGTYQQFGVRGAIAVPLVKNGRFVAGMFAHSREPRLWTDGDEILLADVGERLWGALERARAEAALRDSELLFRTVTQAMPGFAWMADADGMFDYISEQWSDFSGAGPADGLGTGWVTFLHPDDQENAIAAWKASIATGTDYDVEFRVRRHDGVYRWFLVRALPLRDSAGAIVRWVGTGNDVQASVEAAAVLAQSREDLERRVATEVAERVKAEEALRQAQKMEAVGQLTGGIAHDFNNLLTGIIGSLDLLRRRIAAGRMGDVDRFIDAATASANRAAGLTHRLLAFSRRQSLDIKPINLAKLTASIEELLRRTIGEQIRLTTSIAPDIWTVEADPSQLETAILNLAINARDAMPAGGSLVIAAANAQFDAAAASGYDGLAAGDYVAIQVRDTGSGMAPDVLARVFDPFFTTKPIGKGTGLGLSMVYGFAKQSRGVTRVESRVGHGTTVTLYLPRHHGQVDDDEKRVSGETERAREGETVLVVEDDPAVRLLVMEVLADLGYQALQAIDGESAVPILQSKRRIDLLVSDVGLPGLNGRQVAEIARQTRPGLGVLFITGYAENAAVRGEFLDPGMELIGKPFALDVLAAKIREMLSR